MMIIMGRLSVNAMAVGSIPTRSSKLLSFPRSGNKTIRFIEVCFKRAMSLKLGGKSGTECLNTICKYFGN